MTNAANMDTLARLADHAAVQSDRWLFVCLLIVVLAAIWLVARYVMRDRDRLVDTLNVNQNELVKLVEQVSGVVATNTAALTRVSDEIRFCSGRANGRNPIA